MQETDVRIGLGDDFAVQFEDQAQHAMRRRMARPHVQHQLFPDDVFGHLFHRFEVSSRAGGDIWGLDFTGDSRHVGRFRVWKTGRLIRPRRYPGNTIL